MKHEITIMSGTYIYKAVFNCKKIRVGNKWIRYE